jgi:molybdopterin converting factor small subunit
MLTSPSRAAQSNVRWDDVVDSTLIQSLMAPAVRQRRDEDGRASDIRVHVQLFGALASITTERTLDLVVPKPATVAAVVAAIGARLGQTFLARVVDEAGTKQRYCRLFVAGVQIEDLQTPIDADSVDIEMILLVAIEGG